jgi:16S rRNA (guanine(527)-N(7))-methyltransferase RsmG
LNLEYKDLQSLIGEIPPDSQSALQIEKYYDLLKKWNARINLTASTEWRVIEPLFREGIWASRIYPAESAAHLDIGTGAGFPAIMLKILNPHIRLEMVESRSKKGAFLETVVQTLALKNASVHINRLDEFLKHNEKVKTWDCITWKGIKLNNSDLIRLKKHSHSRTQFWMFHGKDPATENPDVIEQLFTLYKNEKMPGMNDWCLSVYKLRQQMNVSRETK